VFREIVQLLEEYRRDLLITKASVSVFAAFDNFDIARAPGRFCR